MRSRLDQKFTRTQKYKILRLLKAQGALSVPDLLKKLNLSYMGIKQHCVELERDGYLEKKRRPKSSGRGRPEQAYELTEAAEECFPHHDTLLTQQIIQALCQLYGTNAPEKILYTIYQNNITRYRQNMTAMLLEDRVQEFIRLREEDGYLIELLPESSSKVWKILESHSPLKRLLMEFPVLMNFELQLYQKTLHAMVKRSIFQKNPFRAIYSIPMESAS